MDEKELTEKITKMDAEYITFCDINSESVDFEFGMVVD